MYVHVSIPSYVVTDLNRYLGRFTCFSRKSPLKTFPANEQTKYGISFELLKNFFPFLKIPFSKKNQGFKCETVSSITRIIIECNKEFCLKKTVLSEIYNGSFIFQNSKKYKKLIWI